MARLIPVYNIGACVLWSSMTILRSAGEVVAGLQCLPQQPVDKTRAPHIVIWEVVPVPTRAGTEDGLVRAAPAGGRAVKRTRITRWSGP